MLYKGHHNFCFIKETSKHILLMYFKHTTLSIGIKKQKGCSCSEHLYEMKAKIVCTFTKNPNNTQINLEIK